MHFDHPEEAVVLLERGTQEGSRGIAGLLIDTPKKPGILRDIVAHHAVPGLRHPAGDALAQREAKGTHLGRPHHGDKGEFVRRRVDERETTPFRIEQAYGGSEDDGEHLIGIDGTHDQVYQVEEALQTLRGGGTRHTHLSTLRGLTSRALKIRPKVL